MIKIGGIYHSNNYGPIQILDKRGQTNYYLVRFLRTGTEKQFRMDQILAGCIRDPFAPSFCGVACIGDIKTKGMYKTYYSIWHDMINRCYNKKDKRSKSYYGRVFVTPRWLVFKNFYDDCKLIEGFDDKKIRSGELVLDKDIKQRFQEQKIYSIDTCMWVSKNINNTIQDFQQREFYGLSPDGVLYKGYNITKFAREHNLNRKHISGVLHGRTKTTAGWRFSYEEIV